MLNDSKEEKFSVIYYLKQRKKCYVSFFKVHLAVHLVLSVSSISSV